MTTYTSEKFNSIDISKFILAFFVVAIHTSPLSEVENPAIKNLFIAVTDCAVPFFFLSSGFLLANKAKTITLNMDFKKIIIKHLFKTIKLYSLWYVIYTPLSVYYYITTNLSFSYSFLHYLRGFLIFGENYNSWMLWYLLSTIYALLFMIFLLNHKASLKTIFICGTAFFLLGLLITYFVNFSGPLPTHILFIQKIVSTLMVNGRIFTGFLYIPLGFLFAETKLPNILSASLFICGLFINFIFNGFIGDIALVMFSVGLFSIVSQIPLKNSPLYPILRNISTIIYFIHMYVWTLYYSLMYQKKTFGLDSFIVVCLVSTCFAIFIIWLKKPFGVFASKIKSLILFKRNKLAR